MFSGKVEAAVKDLTAKLSKVDYEEGSAERFVHVYWIFQNFYLDFRGIFQHVIPVFKTLKST